MSNPWDADEVVAPAAAANAPPQSATAAPAPARQPSGVTYGGTSALAGKAINAAQADTWKSLDIDPTATPGSFKYPFVEQEGSSGADPSAFYINLAGQMVGPKLSDLAASTSASAPVAPVPSAGAPSGPAAAPSATPWDADEVVSPAGASAAPAATSTLSDVAHQVFDGIPKGAAAIAGLPGDVLKLGGFLGDKAADGISAVTGLPLGPATPANKVLGLTIPGSSEINDAIQAVDGKYAAPQTTAGRYAGAVASFIPAVAEGPGGVFSKFASAAVPAVASEGLGQMTQGTALEPFARVLGGVAGGLGIGSVDAALNAPRVGAEAAAHAPVSLATHDAAGITPMLATSGPQSAQRVGQFLGGLPLVGKPIQAAARAQAVQADGTMDRIAGGYGAATTPEEAGAPIASANQSAASQVEAARAGLGQQTSRVASAFGASPNRQQLGESVQAGIERFAKGDGSSTVDAESLPARATSFSEKSGALYDNAFGRLENEMAAKGGGLRSTAAPPAPNTGSTTPLHKMADTVWKPGPSLLDFIGQNGGLHDQGGEVSAMDGDKWHLDLGHTGSAAFRSKLIKPTGSGLESMAERAHDAGYFPDAKDPAWSGNDNTQAVSGGDLLDAMRGELAGRKRYAGYVEPPIEGSPALARGQSGVFPAPERTAAGNAGWIKPTATQGVIKDIAERGQSPHVRGLLDAPQVQQIAKAVSDPSTLSFNDLRSLRTWTRQAQKNPELRGNISTSDLQRLEGAMSSDIYANASRLGSPEAAAQLRRADQFYGAGSKRISDGVGQFFRAATPEAAADKVIAAASRGAGANINSLQALRRTLRPAEWRDVASGAITRGSQGRDGGFDLDALVKFRDGLSPDGRDILFGGENKLLGRSLENLVARGREVQAMKPDVHFAADAAPAFNGLFAAARVKGNAASVASIDAARAALPEKAWGDIAATGLRTMGRGNDGEFSLATWSTEWNKLSEGGKRAIYGGPGREKDVASLNALADMSSQLKRASAFYNHSQSGSHSIFGGAIMVGADKLMEGDLMAATHTAVLGALGYGAAKLLASPGAARAVLRSVRAAGPGQVEAADKALVAYARRYPDVAPEISQYRKAYFTHMQRQVGLTAATAGGVAQQASQPPQ